jgi:carbon-monoxide dehydrogenase large subunit
MVLTGREAAEATEPIPYFIDPAGRGGRRVDVRCLEPELVTYVGQPIAAVVARTRAQARAAARLVCVEYEELPHVLDAEQARAADAPRVYPQWPDNIVFSKVYGTGEPDAQLAEADVTITQEFRVARSTTAPIEPRGYLASWDRIEERLTIHGSCQNPPQLRWMLANTLRLEESRIHVVTA